MRRALPFLVLSALIIAPAAAPAGVAAQEPAAPGAPAAGEPGAAAADRARPFVAVLAGPALDGLVTVGVQVGVFEGSRGWVVRGAYSEELEMFGPTPALSVWDVGVLRAVRSDPARGYATAAVGVALTGGMNRGRYVGEEGGWFGSSIYERDPFTTVGVVGAVGVGFAPASFFSVGLDLSGNVNPQRPYVAAAVRLAVGALR